MTVLHTGLTTGRSVLRGARIGEVLLWSLRYAIGCVGGVYNCLDMSCLLSTYSHCRFDQVVSMAVLWLLWCGFLVVPESYLQGICVVMCWQDYTNIFNLLAAILHLGQLNFTGSRGGQAEFTNKDVLLLGKRLNIILYVFLYPLTLCRTTKHLGKCCKTYSLCFFVPLLV